MGFPGQGKKYATDGSWEIIAAKDKNFLFRYFMLLLYAQP